MPRTMVHPRLKRILSESSSAVSSPPDTASDAGWSFNVPSPTNMTSKQCHGQASPNQSRRTKIQKSIWCHTQTKGHQMQSTRLERGSFPSTKALGPGWTYPTRTPERPRLKTTRALRTLTPVRRLNDQERMHSLA